jgi:hypothetical protein
MNLLRRRIVNFSLVLVGLSGVSACAQSVSQSPSRMSAEAEQVRMNRFQDVGSAEWILSTLSELSYIHIYDQDGRIISAPSGLVGQGGGRFSINRIPIQLKVTWREKDLQNPIINRGMGPTNSVYREVWSGGKITGSFEIPVAERIPDELLDDLRRDPKGSLRIKVRLHRDGVLLGWDIERRPGYDRNKRDIYGEAAYVGPVHSFAGGDFREAEIFNGNPVRMGWYIHPKTGQRIETPY